LPVGGGAAGGVGRGIGEVERAENVGGRVEKRNDFGPSDVFSGIGSCWWVEKDAIAVVEDIVGTQREGMPFGPPTGCNIGTHGVGGVAGVEVAIVKAGRCSGVTARVDAGLVEVDGDKVPMGAEGARVKVGDEKEPIGRGKNGSGEFEPGGGAGGWGG
jgi:hypothetical protein